MKKAAPEAIHSEDLIEKNKSATLAIDLENRMAKIPLVYNIFNSVWHELVFNETIALLSKDADIYISLPEILNNWNIRISFEQNFTNSNIPTVSTVYKDKETAIILKNWYGDSAIQNTEPIVLNSKDSKLSILVKIRSEANLKQERRLISVSIWKKQA